MRPLDELDLRDELGLDPVTSELRTRGIFGISANGESARSSGAQQREQPLDLGVGEARADVARPAQHTRVVYPGDERAEPAGAATLPARVPGDHDLLGLAELHLPPVGRPAAGPVRRVHLLGDDALELLLARGREQRLAVVELRRDEHAGAAPDELLETLCARSASGSSMSGSDSSSRRSKRHEHERAAALLEEREARAAALVERADLAVEHGVGRADREVAARATSRNGRSGRCRFGS